MLTVSCLEASRDTLRISLNFTSKCCVFRGIFVNAMRKSLIRHRLRTAFRSTPVPAYKRCKRRPRLTYLSLSMRRRMLLIAVIHPLFANPRGYFAAATLVWPPSVPMEMSCAEHRAPWRSRRDSVESASRQRRSLRSVKLEITWRNASKAR